MIGLSSFLALVVAATVWLALRNDEYVAPSPGPAASSIRPAEAAAALGQLSEAVRRRDVAAVSGLAAEGDRAAGRALSALVRNAAAIPVSDFDLRYLDELGGLDDQGEWRAVASVTWRYDGFDREVSSSEIEVRFAEAGGDVVITAIGGAEGRRPVWMDPAAGVRRSARALTVAAGRVGHYHRLATRAVTVVRRVVPGWTTGLVVEVPATAAALDRALGAEPGTFDGVAGVTASPDGDAEDGRAAHVFLNPERMSRLEPRGAQVVVSHEAAHVALGATESDLPVWLSEGMADYVALRDVPLPLSTAASQIIDRVRREGPPRSLPDEEDFDDDSEYFGAAYEASWLACRMLAARSGERELLEFYRRADGRAGLEPLFERVFGLTLRRFTREWRRSLSDLAA